MPKRPGVLSDGTSPTSSPVSGGVTTTTAGNGKMTDDNFVLVPTREEKRKQRKMEKHRPQFSFDMGYFKNGKKVGIAHLRDMLLYIVADAQRPSWIVPETAISHTVVLFIPGLLPEHLGIPPIPTNTNMPFVTSSQDSTSTSPIPIIKQLFTYGCPTRAPGDQRKLHSVLGTLLASPLPDDVRKRKEEETRMLAAVAKSDSASPLIYLLTPSQMLDNDYRLPSYLDPSSDLRTIPGLDVSTLKPELAALLGRKEDTGEMTAVPESYSMASKNGVLLHEGRQGDDDTWVETAQASVSPTEGSAGHYPILAMDCEMVVTEDGQELARVSIIDFTTGQNIFDHFVKTGKPVLDYRTQWSGITSEKLSTASHTLKSIQKALVTGPEPIITPSTILLGHSLECDLTALKIRHPLCIDTALIFKHPRGPPYKPGLKWLAQRWMGKEIQTSKNGHDSEEDARTCVELLKLKMANGPDFGSFTDTTESIFERMNRYVVDMNTKATRRTGYCDYGNPKSGMGGKATSVAKCNADDEIMEKTGEFARDHDFVFGRFMELAQAQGWDERNRADPDQTEEEKETAVKEALSKLNDRISKLHAGLDPNTAFIIITGHSNPLPMLHLSAKRQKWERMVKQTGTIDEIPKEERWMAEDDRLLETATAEAREGMAFFCVKR